MTGSYQKTTPVLRQLYNLVHSLSGNSLSDFDLDCYFDDDPSPGSLTHYPTQLVHNPCDPWIHVSSSPDDLAHDRDHDQIYPAPLTHHGLVAVSLALVRSPKFVAD